MTRAPDGGPLLFAHRGFAGENPGNTVAAAEAAADDGGADWVEIDVVPTADGDPVVFHDAELSGRGGPPGAPDDRGLTDATGTVRETDTATVTAAENRENDVLVSSFHEAALAATRERSECPVAPLFSESVEDALAIARRYDAAAVHPPIDAVRGTPFFDASQFGDADVVAAAHDAGRAVNVWTVETWYQADRLSAAGVDGLIADYSTLEQR